MGSETLFCEKFQDFDFSMSIWNEDRFCSPGVSHGTKFVYIGCNGTLSFDRDAAKINEWLRSTWASEKPVKGFAVLIAAQALCAVPQLGMAQQAESRVLNRCNILDRAELG